MEYLEYLEYIISLTVPTQSRRWVSYSNCWTIYWRLDQFITVSPNSYFTVNSVYFYDFSWS